MYFWASKQANKITAKQQQQSTEEYIYSMIPFFEIPRSEEKHYLRKGYWEQGAKDLGSW